VPRSLSNEDLLDFFGFVVSNPNSSYAHFSRMCLAAGRHPFCENTFRALQVQLNVLACNELERQIALAHEYLKLLAAQYPDLPRVFGFDGRYGCV
jgi:hypothetical protein